jgi:hypothetical protein
MLYLAFAANFTSFNRLPSMSLELRMAHASSQFRRLIWFTRIYRA